MRSGSRRSSYCRLLPLLSDWRMGCTTCSTCGSIRSLRSLSDPPRLLASSRAARGSASAAPPRHTTARPRRTAGGRRRFSCCVSQRGLRGARRRPSPRWRALSRPGSRGGVHRGARRGRRRRARPQLRAARTRVARPALVMAHPGWSIAAVGTHSPSSASLSPTAGSPRSTSRRPKSSQPARPNGSNRTVVIRAVVVTGVCPGPPEIPEVLPLLCLWDCRRVTSGRAGPFPRLRRRTCRRSASAVTKITEDFTELLAFATPDTLEDRERFARPTRDLHRSISSR